MYVCIFVFFQVALRKSFALQNFVAPVFLFDSKRNHEIIILRFHA